MAKGDFAGAAALLAPPPSGLTRSVPQPLKGAGIRSAMSEGASPGLSSANDVPLWPMVVVAPQIDVGKPASITLDWAGAAAPHPKVVGWSVEPESVARIAPEGESALVTPNRAGRLVVTVRFEDGTCQALERTPATSRARRATTPSLEKRGGFKSSRASSPRR